MPMHRRLISAAAVWALSAASAFAQVTPASGPASATARAVAETAPPPLDPL